MGRKRHKTMGKQEPAAPEYHTQTPLDWLGLLDSDDANRALSNLVMPPSLFFKPEWEALYRRTKHLICRNSFKFQRGICIFFRVLGWEGSKVEMFVDIGYFPPSWQSRRREVDRIGDGKYKRTVPVTERFYPIWFADGGRNGAYGALARIDSFEESQTNERVATTDEDPSPRRPIGPKYRPFYLQRKMRGNRGSGES